MGRFRMLMATSVTPPPPPPPPVIVYWLDANRTDGLAESDRAAIAVFKAAGLCENDEYMTTDEAAAVEQLPSFEDVTALIDWDWSALSGMNNLTLFRIFKNATNLALTSLPAGFGSVAKNMGETFRGCTNLALTSLPAGFGSVATNFTRTFISCTNLALTSLPAGFGSVATNMGETFRGCTNLALTSLPAGFGSVATNITRTFISCTNLALTSLPAGFGSVATNMGDTFRGCTNLALTSLPAGFGGRSGCSLSKTFFDCTNLALTNLPDGFGNMSDMTQTFTRCTNLVLTSLPASVGTGVNFMQTFDDCTKIIGEFAINNNNFGQNAHILSKLFNGTKITKFKNGAFDFSNVNKDTTSKTTYNALESMCPTTCTHIEFVANTLKFSTSTIYMHLENIDTESLLSLARCLSSAASGKTLTVTSAQFDTLMTEMYNDSLNYVMYCIMKGWSVESA